MCKELMRTFLLVTVLLAAVDGAAAQTCKPAEAVTSYGAWFSPSVQLNSGNWSQRFDSGLSSIASLKLRIDVTAALDREFNVVVRDRKFRVLASFGARDFDGPGHGSFRSRWTGRLPTDEVIVDLIAPTAGDVTVDLNDGIAYQKASSDTRLFSIQSSFPRWASLYDSSFTPAKRAGDAVGMLVGAAILEDGQKASWCCSAVMVGRDLLLTNWHCGGVSGMPEASYWNSDVCGNTIIDLGWDDGVVSRQYACSDVIAKNRNLDFALIRVRPVVGLGGASGEPVRARASKTAILASSEIFVVHHAQCQPKLVSSQCHVISPSLTQPTDGAQANSEFTHDCDTEPGASGAPVFDTAGKLVGLHHAGFDRDLQCHAIDHVNKAVKITEIVEFLRSKNLDEARELGVE